jgi:hypothetical protein
MRRRVVEATSNNCIDIDDTQRRFQSAFSATSAVERIRRRRFYRSVTPNGSRLHGTVGGSTGIVRGELEVLAAKGVDAVRCW